MGLNVFKSMGASASEKDAAPENKNVINTDKVKDTNNQKMETIFQRGMFEANGYQFSVSPIFLEEIDEYINDQVYVPNKYNEDETEKTDKQLGEFLIGCFARTEEEELEDESFQQEPKSGFLQKNKTTETKDKADYSKYPLAQGFIKWIERKVSYKNELIKFQDLEHKFFLTKGEIARLIIYISELSGF